MNAVEVKKLTKKFKDFTLDNITFSLPQGCILGLIGRNGSGKSTLIDILCTIVRPDSGEASIFGVSVLDPNFTAVKEHIGYVTCSMSFPYIFTAADMNKILRACYKTWNEDRFFSYLKEFHLDESKKISDYSDGMLMMLQIAAALSHDTRLLLFDEATNGLDAVMRERVTDILMEFTERADRSVIIASHISSDLDKICDYIAYFDNGRLGFFECKDALCDKLAVVKCGSDALKAIDGEYIVGCRHFAYGVEALCRKEGIPDGMYSEQVKLDDIIIFANKEENQ